VFGRQEIRMKSFLERQYHLEKNPFENRVDPAAPMAGRKKEHSEWKAVINQKKGSASNSLNFIVGDYGFGKTLSLYHIVEEFESDSKLLAIYMKFLPEDKVSRFGLNFVQRIFKAIGVYDKWHLFKGADVSFMEHEFPGPSRIFELICGIEQDADGTLKDLAEIFLYGERNLTKAEMSLLGITRLMNSTDIAKDYLYAFLLMMRHESFVSLILTVDEVEYIFSQMRGNAMAGVFNTLRELSDLQNLPPYLQRAERLDAHPANIIYFFGISQSGWSSIQDLDRKEIKTPGPVQPLLSRADRVIELSPLNKKETRDLIQKRLYMNRVTGKVESKPLIPFDDSFVDYIADLAMGNPRDIIVRCEYVIRDGLRDEIPLLTKSYAQKVFEAHRLRTE